MQTYFLGFLVFVLGYSVSKFLFRFVPALAELTEVVSVALGVAAALLSMGLLK